MPVIVSATVLPDVTARRTKWLVPNITVDVPAGKRMRGALT
jgi:hypothetical protein